MVASKRITITMETLTMETLAIIREATITTIILATIPSIDEFFAVEKGHSNSVYRCRCSKT